MTTWLKLTAVAGIFTATTVELLWMCAAVALGNPVAVWIDDRRGDAWNAARRFCAWTWRPVGETAHAVHALCARNPGRRCKSVPQRLGLTTREVSQ